MRNLSFFAIALFLFGQGLHAAPVPGTCVGGSCFWSLRDTSGVIHNVNWADRTSDDPLTFPELEDLSPLLLEAHDMVVRGGQVLVVGRFRGGGADFFNGRPVGYAWNTEITATTLDDGSFIQLDRFTDDPSGNFAAGAGLRADGLGGAVLVGHDTLPTRARSWRNLAEETGTGPHGGNNGALYPVEPGTLFLSLATHINDEGTHSIGTANTASFGLIPYITSFDANGVPQSTTILHDGGGVPILPGEDLFGSRGRDPLFISSLQQDGEVVVLGSLAEFGEDDGVFRWEGDPDVSLPSSYKTASAVLASSGLPIPAGIDDYNAKGLSADGSRALLEVEPASPNRGLVWEVDALGQDQMAWIVENSLPPGATIGFSALSDDGRIAAGGYTIFDEGIVLIWDVDAALADPDGEYENSAIDFNALLADTFGASWESKALQIQAISYLEDLDSYLFAVYVNRAPDLQEVALVLFSAEELFGPEVPVPEPATLLLITTLGGTAAAVKRRKMREAS